MKKSEVRVSARSVYAFGKRKRTVYDASGTHNGIEYSVQGASSRAEAIASAIAEVSYRASAGELAACGFRLLCNGTREWFLRFPHGGGMCFAAEDLASALARVASDYRDHAEVSAFVREVSACEVSARVA